MSFRCEECKQTQPVGTSPNRTVVAVRTKYSHEADREVEEIAQEKNLCDTCAAPYELVTSQRVEGSDVPAVKEPLEQSENQVGRA